MASQEIQKIDSLVNKAVSFIEKNTTFKEQFKCFVYCYVLLSRCGTLSSAFIVWLPYFLLTIVSSFLRDDLKISPVGWKEKCTFKKVGIVLTGIIVEIFGYKIEDLFADFRDIVKRQAPSLLGHHDLVVTPVGSDAGNQNATKERLTLDYCTTTKYELKCLLKKCQDMETELKMQNNHLLNQLAAAKSACNHLRNSQIDAMEHIDLLKEELELEKKRNDKLRRLLQDNESDSRKEIHTLKETITELEYGKRWFLKRRKEYANEITAKIDAGVLKYKEEKEIEMNEMKEANERLEVEKDMMVMKLQKANETTEFYMKLLEDYHIV